MTPTQARLAAERRARLERMHQASLQHFDRCYDEAFPRVEITPAPAGPVLPALPVPPRATLLIQEAVCKKFGIDRRDLIGPVRKPIFVKPRQIAMFLTRELLALSYPRIATEFRRCDHSAVIHSVRIAQKMIDRDPAIAATVAELREELSAEKESAGITPRASADASMVSA